ncbi:hypothetical protein Desaci_1447 [Desulfosporosinus acidiphilus SJ4]|uniref:TrbL/VirB6 plasmid conjugal transfer protein n=1 Tax=Desulfosporosinus acidiphilus (strain DSM 22704 / JCM 16185 / SJ4) TaxID=646529 RepID=I4D3U0_DESAJ|nr:hypothetical protein [Desulfosporosinus acidiphilus]AFM40464.1 hypothetical protein Desaci_1447 [Desulfosporosinus acidiphilus SJ4]
MKRISVLILTLLILFNVLGGPVWAAETIPSGASSTTSSSSGGSFIGDLPILGQIYNGVNDVKTSVSSVVDFFQNFDPGKIINDWMKQTLSDFLRPIVSWAEQNAAEYSYVNKDDPSFTWWELLVILALALMLYATLRMAGQVMAGKRPAGDVLISFGLILWVFLSIWVTNLMVYARNHITYILLDWMVGQHWLSPDALQTTAQFIVPDLSKAIMANQDAVSAILAFLLGGLIILAFEFVQALVYGVWLLLVIGSPFFTMMTTLASDFAPFMSYISGLVRTLIASIIMTVSWGLQGYIYQSQTDTVLQVILQAIVVAISVIVLWTFWWKFIETEILGMLSRPVQTVKGQAASSAGSKLQTAGKAASILGAITGSSKLATAGHKMQTAGDVITEQGESIKLQTSRSPVRHHDLLSRVTENHFRQESASNDSTSASNQRNGFKTTFKGPFTKPPVMDGSTKSPGSPDQSLDSRLDRIEQRIIPEDVHEHFQEVSMPGGGTFYKYEGPMSEDIAEQLKEKGVPVHSFDDSWAVDTPHEKLAKYTVSQTLRGRKRYWVHRDNDTGDPEAKGENYITVDDYGISHVATKPPKFGLNMGIWRKNRKKPGDKTSGGKE